MAEPLGRLDAIWIKPARGRPMDAASRATLVSGRGIEGNFDQGGRRQVTLIEREVFEALRRELDPALEPVVRRANLMVSGIPLAETGGRILRVGSTRIHVRGEARPCQQMEDACTGLLEALRVGWRGGVYGEVLDDGEVAVGDAVTWVGDGAM